MPPRLRLQPQQLLPQSIVQSTPYICHQCRHASLATTPAPPLNDPIAETAPPIARYPPTQPPSHKPPTFRKSQLHRQYQSLLRSCPLTVIFQHNNLRATEWMGVRRELATALRKVDEKFAGGGDPSAASIGAATKFVVVQTGIFASALRVVEFWDPKFDGVPSPTTAVNPTAMDTASPIPSSENDSATKSKHSDYTHGLSTPAYIHATKSANRTPHGLEPLLSGPLALLTFPSVSPAHLAAALSILSPTPAFPAPRRRTNPAYHEPAVQNGVQKLMMLGARVEGKVFDMEGTRWVAGIEGGLEGLRAQLVAVLGGVGAGLTGTLEMVGRSLWVTVEGRRGMLEEKGEGGKE